MTTTEFRLVPELIGIARQARALEVDGSSQFQSGHRDMVVFYLSFVAAVLLGLLAGSLFLEGLVLVPFFKKLTPEQFFAFHPIFGDQLFRFFAPLTTVAVLMPVMAAIGAGGSDLALNVAAAGGLAVLAFFPLYFRRANEAFANQQVSADELPGRLAQWGLIHGARTVIAVATFGAAVLGVRATI